MSKKILIIDDDPNIIKYLEEIFVENGYETISAENAEVALKIVKENKPDLITLDIEMPGDWGTRFYRKLTLTKENKNIPIIVISGLTGNEYAVTKAVASFTKPFKPEALLKTVKDTIG